MTKIVKISVFFLLVFCPLLSAQGVRYVISPLNAEPLLREEQLRATVDYLTDPATGGRAMGTEGGAKVAAWLSSAFLDLGLEPLNGAFQHGFTAGETFGRNVIGLIPGCASVPRYVLVMAHYDNLGNLKDTFYPGADSNASGVAALLELARMMARMHALKRDYGASLLFVALDGKEKDLAGADALWRGIAAGQLLDPVTGKSVSAADISLVVNIDQLGAVLSPVTPGNPDYLLMLSRPAGSRRATLASVNKDRNIGLELAYDYYGSKDFTRLFYEQVSDQSIFLRQGIPAVMFTSGITLNNNKPWDDADSLDYAVLRKRVRLIFYFLDKML